MGTKPDFYDALRASGLKVQYDHHIRNLLRFRPVISHILIRTLREYSGLSPLEASALIDPVHTEAMLVGESIEDAVPDEGEVLYDLRFSAEIPISEEAVPDSASKRNADCSRTENRATGKSLCLLINLEAQKSFTRSTVWSPGASFTGHGCFPPSWDGSFRIPIIRNSKRSAASGSA